MDNLIMAKGVDKRNDEIVFRWFGHVERMENDSSSKKVYVERVLVVGQWVGVADGLILF